MKCEICQQEFEKQSIFHRHLTQKHFLSQQEYYHSYKPRYDKFSGDIIVYKNLESYLSTDFNSRDNFCQWLLDNSHDENAVTYLFDKIHDRLKSKGLEFFPTQIDLKSIFAPSWLSLIKMFGSIKEAVGRLEEYNFKLRYKYVDNLKLDINKDMHIVQDTREQCPLSFENKSKIMKLPCGDYAPTGDLFCNVVIERKSLQDLIGTLTSGLDRFKREIEKARGMGFYLVILIESSYSSTLNYKSSSGFTQKINGAHIMHEIRDINNEFGDCCQFLFSNNRFGSIDLVYKIFSLKERVKDFDLEFLKDRRII